MVKTVPIRLIGLPGSDDRMATITLTRSAPTAYGETSWSAHAHVAGTNSQAEIRDCVDERAALEAVTGWLRRKLGARATCLAAGGKITIVRLHADCEV